MFVNIPDALNTFEKYWTSPSYSVGRPDYTLNQGLGNVSSPRLRKTWESMFLSYHGVISRFSPHSMPLISEVERLALRHQWTCLGPATGTGKSEGAYFYLGQHARAISKLTFGDWKPGAMLVCRSTKQCDEAVEAINSWAGEVVAVARHSAQSPRTTLRETQRYPVLVITHASFVNSLEYLDDHKTRSKLIDGALLNTADLISIWDKVGRSLR